MLWTVVKHVSHLCTPDTPTHQTRFRQSTICSHNRHQVGGGVKEIRKHMFHTRTRRGNCAQISRFKFTKSRVWEKKTTTTTTTKVKVIISSSPLTSIGAAGQHGQNLQRRQESQPESPVSWVHGVRVSGGLDGSGRAECVSLRRDHGAQNSHNSHGSNS